MSNPMDWKGEVEVAHILVRALNSGFRSMKRLRTLLPPPPPPPPGWDAIPSKGYQQQQQKQQQQQQQQQLYYSDICTIIRAYN